MIIWSSILRRTSRPLATVCIALMLMSTARCQGTYGCQVAGSNNTDCSGHGLCEQFGICTCVEGYFGEACDKNLQSQTYKSDLAKGFITFWVLFWIIINLLVPYLICLLIMYLKEKNCNTVKEHFSECRKALCCCFKERERGIMIGGNEEPERLVPRSEAQEKSVELNPVVNPIRDEEKIHSEENNIFQSVKENPSKTTKKALPPISTKKSVLIKESPDQPFPKFGEEIQESQPSNPQSKPHSSVPVSKLSSQSNSKKLDLILKKSTVSAAKLTTNSDFFRISLLNYSSIKPFQTEPTDISKILAHDKNIDDKWSSMTHTAFLNKAIDSLA